MQNNANHPVTSCPNVIQTRVNTLSIYRHELKREDEWTTSHWTVCECTAGVMRLLLVKQPLIQEEHPNSTHIYMKRGTSHHCHVLILCTSKKTQEFNQRLTSVQITVTRTEDTRRLTLNKHGMPSSSATRKMTKMQQRESSRNFEGGQVWCTPCIVGQMTDRLHLDG